MPVLLVIETGRNACPTGDHQEFERLREQLSGVTTPPLVGVSPRDAQELAPQSDVRLTMSVYSHVALQDKARAVEKLVAAGG